MNTVWNSYGQLLQLPEKTSKKMQIFFVVGLTYGCRNEWK